MSLWTHAMCERCWISRNTTHHPNGDTTVRAPVRMAKPRLDLCCFCRKETIFGIYVRHDPAPLALPDGTPCHAPDED